MATTIGEQCVQWAMQHVGMVEEGANTGPVIRKWLYECVRRDTGERLGLTRGNWCASFACAAPIACGYGVSFGPTAEVPHGYRAAVVEMVADAMSIGAWRPFSLVVARTWTPMPGDLVVWDRAVAGRPETAWWRHVNRVVNCWRDKNAFETVGGNEQNAVRTAVHAFTDMGLLGFIEYPRAEVLKFDLDEQERQAVLAHVAMSLDVLSREVLG